jgi:DNA ligase-associated metallophosphoesterase
MTEILLQDERLFLLPERAVWWPAQKAILLSDLHWGKSAHFRKHGIPMPGSTQVKDSNKLAELVQRFGAERMIVAGDFFHSKHNKEVDDFGTWREAHSSLHIDFILGNHDILPTKYYDEWHLQVHKEGLLVNDIYIAHDLEDDTEHFTIHGHIHPGMRVHGLGRQGFSLPCFCVNEKCMVLPAFGQFTGCHLIDEKAYKNVYLIGDGKVIQWK